MFNLLIGSLAWSAEIIFIYMSAWFILALIFKRNDLADIAWGPGFILVSVLLFIKGGITIDRGMLVTLLVIIWGSRLAYHIFKRNIGKPEDKRYVAWRNAWGKWFILRSYFQIFILQGILLFLVVTPVSVVNILRGGSITVFDFLGLIVWLIGFYFESVGDKQLKEFLSDPQNKGKILNTGLWKYTRHPNYFGEVTQWWGLWIISLSMGYPFGLIGIIGPATITFLILKVSGVPMLEKSMAENPLFDEYRRTTSVFLPRWKRK